MIFAKDYPKIFLDSVQFSFLRPTDFAHICFGFGCYLKHRLQKWETKKDIKLVSLRNKLCRRRNALIQKRHRLRHSAVPLSIFKRLLERSRGSQPGSLTGPTLPSPSISHFTSFHRLATRITLLNTADLREQHTSKRTCGFSQHVTQPR